MALGRFGNLFKDLRMAQGLTLRAFCLKYKQDAGNISRLERGRVTPPDSEDILRNYAVWLGLKEGTEQWTDFFDLARAEQGQIPQDMLDDELIEKLPVVFRLMRGAKLDGESLDDLIEKIRKA